LLEEISREKALTDPVASGLKAAAADFAPLWS
jgi:hypothetical protein